MSIEILKKMIEVIRIQILILQIQLKIKLFKEKLTIPNLHGPKHIMGHHSAGVWTLEQVNNHHKNRWGFKSSLGYYVGYHYWIDYDGTVTQTRSDHEEGAHCVERGNPHYWNKNAVGICLRGDKTKTKIFDAQLEGWDKLVKKLSKKYNIPKNDVFGHQEIQATLCPGYLMSWIKDFRKVVS